MRDLSLWFADGSNYPGTANIRERKRWFAVFTTVVDFAIPVVEKKADAEPQDEDDTDE